MKAVAPNPASQYKYSETVELRAEGTVASSGYVSPGIASRQAADHSRMSRIKSLSARGLADPRLDACGTRPPSPWQL